MMRNTLHIYTVYIKPGEAPYESAEIVPEGFSPFAFLFGALWMFYHRLWLHGVLIFIIEAMIGRLSYAFGLAPQALVALALGFKISVGYLAWDWVRARLQRKGYVMGDIITGDSRLRAEQRFYDRALASSV